LLVTPVRQVTLKTFEPEAIFKIPFKEFLIVIIKVGMIFMYGLLKGESGWTMI
jgi:hypothetical protein